MGKGGKMPPKVDLKKCTGDGNCVAVCPSNVYELKKGKSFVARPKDCTECGLCVSNCPTGAITLD